MENERYQFIYQIFILINNLLDIRYQRYLLAYNHLLKVRLGSVAASAFRAFFFVSPTCYALFISYE